MNRAQKAVSTRQTTQNKPQTQHNLHNKSKSTKVRSKRQLKQKHTSTTSTRRNFAIKLVSSTTQQQPPTITSKLTRTQSKTNDFSESEELSSETEESEKAPVVYTNDDFKILPSAVKRLSALNRGFLDGTKTHQTGLRITVDTGGCSGFQYIYTMEDSPNDSVEIQSQLLSRTAPPPQSDITDTTNSLQQLFNHNESGDLFFIKDKHFVVTDLESMAFLKDSQLEYKVELIRSGFMIVNNPNVDLACGCGTSFSKKAGKDDV